MNSYLNGNNKYSFYMGSSPFKPSATTQGSISTIDSFNLNRNKYSGDKSSSSITARRKAIAIGKNKYRHGVNPGAASSYATINSNDVKSALTKVRGGGSVAPAKKGFYA
jgi:hypothetical protein